MKNVSNGLRGGEPGEAISRSCWRWFVLGVDNENPVGENVLSVKRANWWQVERGDDHGALCCPVGRIVRPSETRRNETREVGEGYWEELAKQLLRIRDWRVVMLRRMADE